MSNTYNALIHAKQDGTGEEVANNLSGGGGSDVSPEVEAILNVYGSKNLIPYPYEQTTKTENGITFTDNGDGTVTANGTATDTTIFTMHSSNSFILNNGTYIMDGCPNGGSTNSYYHVIQYANSDNQSIYIYDTGDGTEFTLNGSYGRPDDASILQGIVIIAGTTVNNLTFKPMIRDARITDPTWVTWAMTNRQLTERTTWKAVSGSISISANTQGQTSTQTFSELINANEVLVVGTYGINMHFYKGLSSEDCFYYFTADTTYTKAGVVLVNWTTGMVTLQLGYAPNTTYSVDITGIYYK